MIRGHRAELAELDRCTKQRRTSPFSRRAIKLRAADGRRSG